MIKRFTFQEWMPILLVWLCFVLLPIKRSVEIPVFIMAILGLWGFMRGGWRHATTGAQGAFGLIMLLFWVPQLLSLFDAVNLTRSASSALGFIRFYFAGVYIVKNFTSAQTFRRLGMLVSLVLAFWTLDALIQAFRGQDLFGFLPISDRINGVFGQKLKLGPFLAIYAPILFLYMREKYNFLAHILTLLPISVVLLFSGSRSSWIMFFVILCAYLLYLLASSKRIRAAHLIVFFWGVLLLGGVCYKIYPPFQARFDQTALLFNGDMASVDTALSSRVCIWKTAIAMIKDNPLNGVGVRSFRYAYGDYAQPDDRFLKLSGDGTGQTHAHMIILEILSETGLIGLVAYLAAILLLVRKWLRSSGAQRTVLLPYALATLACLLPFNTHMAFYSSSLGQVIFLCIALYSCQIPEEAILERDFCFNKHHENLPQFI